MIEMFVFLHSYTSIGYRVLVKKDLCIMKVKSYLLLVENWVHFYLVHPSDHYALPNEVDSAATAAATIAAAALASRQQQHQQQQHYQNINQNLQNSGSAFVSLAYASLMPFNQFQSFPLTSNNYVGQPLTTSNLTMESSGIHHQNLHHSNPIEFPSAAVLPNGHSTTMTRFPQLGIQSDVNLQPSCPLNFTYNSPTAYINSTGTLTSVGNYLNTTIPNLINLAPSGTIQALLPNLTYNILTNLNDQHVETLKQQIQLQNWSNNTPYSLIALNQKVSVFFFVSEFVFYGM
uniref:Uncharacterized protein n=1 Tax=Schistosoma haematobium TaxID=6185 RepID=A0A095AZB6_SCHHA